MVSQLIDSATFTTIAFYGVVDTSILLNMILSMWLFKVIVALLDTPFVYAGVYFVRKYITSYSIIASINIIADNRCTGTGSN